MCTYNGGAYLGEQLDSLAAQTRPPDELVICDDKSTDSTVDLIRAFSQHAPFPVRTYCNNENVGVTKNFELAIGHCSGNIIALCDQDDIWLPMKLERLERVLHASPDVGAVFSDAEAVDTELRPLGYRMWWFIGFGPGEQRQLLGGDALGVMLKHNVATGTAMAFRSEYKPLILPLSDLWYHDAWIAFLITAIAPVTVIDEPLVLYRQHPSNQIGAVKRARKDAHSPFMDIYSARIAKFIQARDRLIQHKGTYALTGKTLAQIAAKISHLEARAGLHRSRWRRLPTAVKELFTLRYHRYSKGTRSFLKDALRHVSDPGVSA